MTDKEKTEELQRNCRGIAYSTSWVGLKFMMESVAMIVSLNMISLCEQIDSVNR